MSEQDGWERFLEIMAAAGWQHQPDESSSRPNGAGLHLFGHENGAGYRTDGLWYAPGSYQPSGGNIGTWREWLAAGTSPTPF